MPVERYAIKDNTPLATLSFDRMTPRSCAGGGSAGAIEYNGAGYAVLMATPTDMGDLV